MYLNRPIPEARLNPPIAQISLLTTLLQQQTKSNPIIPPDMVPLNIYLPNYDCIKVYVKDTSNFKQVIQQILLSHKEQRVEPSLEYNQIERYELRMCEGFFKIFFYFFS
jgi:hypothetical protein